ncbi:hypothetical protein ABIA85_009631 [Bradyrhizobium sp. LA6.10]
MSLYAKRLDRGKFHLALSIRWCGVNLGGAMAYMLEG